MNGNCVFCGKELKADVAYPIVHEGVVKCSCGGHEGVAEEIIRQVYLGILDRHTNPANAAFTVMVSAVFEPA